MSGKKTILVTIGFVLSVSMMVSAVSVLAVSRYYSRIQFELLNQICTEAAKQDPEAERRIAAALKEYTKGNSGGAKQGLLSELGYRSFDFSGSLAGYGMLYASAGFLTGVLLFAAVFLYRSQMEQRRILALAEYLEQVNTGKAAVLSASGEDDFSRLEDEIYKTVTFLYQTKDAALQAKKQFANNLSNIAHQMKTPLTAASLSVQRYRQDADSRHLQQAQKQLWRLNHLEEALLVLSRLDAGTLPLNKEETDVFTLLVLAADNLQQMLTDSGTSIDIPESGEIHITADLEWTMEAVMNLIKNCIEHCPGGTVHCFYAQNPLYTEILIWDEGEGFAKEDIPHLFERFYRGQNAKEGGIGIGLALAKEIVERQNGTIRAGNRPGGGAGFEIRFYSCKDKC